jgi:hypothetical protein
LFVLGGLSMRDVIVNKTRCRKLRFCHTIVRIVVNIVQDEAAYGLTQSRYKTGNANGWLVLNRSIQGKKEP